MNDMSTQLRQVLSGQAEGQQAPVGDPSSAPIGSPMSSSQPKEGEILEAKNQVTIAMTLLEQALMKLGSHTEEGRLVMDVLSKLSKNFHKEQNNELIPSQLMSMMNSMPQVGGGSPEQQAMMQAQQGQQQQQPQQQQPQGA